MLAVRLRYTRPLKLLACSYSAVPQSETLRGLYSGPARGEPECIANPPSDSFEDAHYGHVRADGMKVFQHLPDLYDMLCKGTSFRGEFLQEGATAYSVLSSSLDSIISDSSRADGYLLRRTGLEAQHHVSPGAGCHRYV